jgi:enamine deaminase RidA (YjgF/YER057c/UK114 family)
LEAAESGQEKVLKTTVSITETQNFAKVSNAYEKHFVHRPERAALPSSSFQKAAQWKLNALPQYNRFMIDLFFHCNEKCLPWHLSCNLPWEE